jgi:hypothetical protein
MLKIEHSPNSNQIVLKFRKRPSFFTVSLMRAFVIAVSLHLAGYSLFTIHYSTPTEYLLSPPVEVETDPHLHFYGSNRNMAKIDQRGFLTHFPEKPTLSRPSKPSLPKNIAHALGAYTKEYSQERDDQTFVLYRKIGKSLSQVIFGASLD